MSRAITLARIHAVNWYGYNDTLPVEGNLLLAGVTGSGKSILMDLIMTVLVGTDVAHNHFNRSATGAHSDRTLKSYCLLDTKREENGVAQYQRDKGGITYVALEFAWPPGADGGRRAETWGLRIEFRSAAEGHGTVRAFYAGSSMTHGDFLAVSPEDGKKRPLVLTAFRHLVEQQRGGRLFETQEQYLRDMANEQHLNFNRAVLASLLPQAMAFTNRKSFDSFIRDFVLPGDQLNVSDVVASYRSFQAYERDLRELHDQLKRLQEITALHQLHTEAARDRAVARWLAAELAHQHAAGVARDTEAALERVRAEFAEEASRLDVLDQLVADRNSEIELLRNTIRASPGGQVFLYIAERNRTLAPQIEALRAVGTRVDDALRDRARRARRWLAEVRSAPLPEPVDTNALDAAIEQLEGCDAGSSEAVLEHVAAVAEQVRAELNRSIRPTREALDACRRTLGTLREEIGALELGRLPFPTALLRSLQEGIAWKGTEPPAQPLCLLCEVADEEWRAAVEVAFTHKFSLVVTDSDYERAVQIYRELVEDSPQESLVDPAQARHLARPVRPGSLAEKIRAEHPVARAIVSHLFGDVMCVRSPDALWNHDSAILPGGFMRHRGFVGRPRHYDNLPFVGKRGLEQQLALKRSRRRDATVQERSLSAIVGDVQKVIESGSRFVPEHTSLTRDLLDAQRLPELEREWDANVAKLETIDRASFEEVEGQIRRLGEELTELERQRRELLRSQKRGQIQSLTSGLATAKDVADSALRAFERVQEDVGDISVHASRLHQWRAEVVAAYPPPDASARVFERSAVEADKQADLSWTKLVAERKQLALAYPKFDDWAAENPSNAPWDKLWRQVKEANIPDYEQKATAERARWEHLFRNNVLQKLDRALRRMRDDVNLLNTHLRTPIGNDVYQIDAKPSPDFKSMRELVNLNALHQRDELFYAAVDGQMRDTLDRFLRTLVEEPDGAHAARLLDYRQYHDYDLLVSDDRDRQSKPISVDRQGGKMSGGENQSPYFVVILASYLRAYKRHEARRRDPSLALVPIDEAFSKMDTGRIKDCIEHIKRLDLQGVFSMSTGNVPGAFGLCEQLIIVSRNDDRRDGRPHVRNVPVSILRASDEGREWMREHS
ncbi:MAG TPA: SbcC/MukB-like Walker B domain-containing protein [Tepidisphaeraceae bacterium]|nr:SbcC/MukB-like Walker B domain-containing protein [Tepidisphaeraceae bacterium]